MTSFTGLLTNASLGLLSVSPWIFCAIAVVALALAILLIVGRCEVVYVDPEGDYEIYYETHRFMKKVSLHGASKSGKKLIGWSKKPYGKPIDKKLLTVTHKVELYAIWEDVETQTAVTLEINYMHSDEDMVIAKDTFYLNAKLPECDDVIINGWAFEKDGEAVITEDKMEATFALTLYPVFAEDAVESEQKYANNKVVADLRYNVLDKNIYKESHYITLNVPQDYEGFDNFTGWSLTPDGELFLDKSGADSIFGVDFYALTEEKAEEAVEEMTVEVVEEPVIEEAVEEPIVEEVVEEPAIEEVVEEPVVEELFEEIIEEPMPEEPAIEEPVIEEVVEEPVVEEPVIEEVVEEPVVEEPVIEEPVIEEVVEEPVIEEPVAEEPEVVEIPEEVSPTVVPTYIDSEGNKIDIKYSRSFTANLIQSEDTVKDYYSELKNHILSYKGVKSKISWKFDSYNKGRDQLFKMKLRGKTICLYCALNPDDFDKSKYHHEAIDAKIFAEVPMLVKIKSGLGLRKAKELVDIVMANFGIEKDPKFKEVDYVAKYPYEETDPLVVRKLIKILVPDDAIIKVSTKPQEEEAPVVEEPIIEEPVIEEPVVEEVVEEPAIEEPVIEEVAEEPIVEEVVEEVVEEPVVEVIPEPVVEEEPEEVYEEHVVIVEEVTAETADAIAEEQQIDIHVEEGVEYISAKDNKKVIINVDTLSDNFEAHEMVNLATLKAKGLIDKKAKSLKVLARGTLNKPLIVKSGDFSKTAVEMILLTGGNAVHVVYKVK